MSESKVSISNYALQEIGEESIISLSDNTVAAQQCSLRYDSVRRSILQDHNWNFALKRASLALTNETDPFEEYSSIFNLPSDCLRVVMTDREMQSNYGGNPLFNGFKTVGFDTAYTGRDRYKIEGRKFYYDDDVAKVLYVSNFENATQFSPLFVEAFAIRLSSRIAYKITGNRTLAEMKEKQYQLLIKDAKLRDSQEGTTERQSTSSLNSVRF